MVWHTLWNGTPLEGAAAETTALKQQLSVTSNVHAGQLRVRLRGPAAGGAALLDGLSVSVSGGPSKPLVVNGSSQIELDTGQELLSDPVALPVQPGARVTITCQAAESTSAGALTPVLAGGQASLDAQGGMVPAGPAREILDNLLTFPGMGVLSAVTAIEAETRGRVTSLALFGDSITQMGFWPAALEGHLREEFPGRTAVRNLGIAGNRVLHDAPKSQPTFGPAGARRFDPQVFTGEPTGPVVVLIGLNDLVHPASLPETADEVVDADELLSGIGMFAASSHRHGAPALVCTIPPFFGNEAWTARAEAVRQEVNQRLASETDFDAVVDLDEALADRDATAPAQRDDLHIGDRLHPNPAGGKAIALALLPALRLLLDHGSST